MAERFLFASHAEKELAVGVVVAEVTAVPPFAIGSAVPERVRPKVPVVVIGEPEIERNAGTVIETEDTDPLPLKVFQSA